MNTLYEESCEIEGAKKLLCKLQAEYAMSLIPCVLCKCRNKQGEDGRDWFPIPSKYRKMVGAAMLRWLLESKDNMRAYLYGSPEFRAEYETDPKGKVRGITITRL